MGSRTRGAFRASDKSSRLIRREDWSYMKWEYFDRMIVFQDSEQGMVSGLDSWINGAGAEGWELVSAVPLIAPNKDGVAYGTIGTHLVFKRPLAEAAS
jgi:hypothetical protein